MTLDLPYERINATVTVGVTITVSAHDRAKCYPSCSHWQDDDTCTDTADRNKTRCALFGVALDYDGAGHDIRCDACMIATGDKQP